MVIAPVAAATSNSLKSIAVAAPVMVVKLEPVMVVVPERVRVVVPRAIASLVSFVIVSPF